MIAEINYDLTNYEVIQIIKDQREKQILLVRHILTGDLRICKMLSTNLCPLYDRLKDYTDQGCSGIPKIISLQKAESRLIVIENYIVGETLAERLSHGNLNTGEAIRIIRRLCEILKPLHEATPPIIHRDIKPENIMFSTSGEIILLDFDAARWYDPEMNRDTLCLGTSGFAPPEQYGFSQTDPRSDLYALGVLLNVMITGELPTKKQAPGPVKSVIKKAIRMNPDQRYQSVKELELVLKGLSAQFPGTSNAETKWTAWCLPGFRSRRWWKMILSGSFYGFLSLFCILCLVVEKPVDSVTILFVLISGLFPVCFIFNYRGICSRLPLMHHPNFGVRTIGFLLWFLLFVFLLVEFSILLGNLILWVTDLIITK